MKFISTRLYLSVHFTFYHSFSFFPSLGKSLARFAIPNCEFLWRTVCKLRELSPLPLICLYADNNKWIAIGLKRTIEHAMNRVLHRARMIRFIQFVRTVVIFIYNCSIPSRMCSIFPYSSKTFSLFGRMLYVCGRVFFFWSKWNHNLTHSCFLVVVEFNLWFFNFQHSCLRVILFFFFPSVFIQLPVSISIFNINSFSATALAIEKKKAGVGERKISAIVLQISISISKRQRNKNYLTEKIIS